MNDNTKEEKFDILEGLYHDAGAQSPVLQQGAAKDRRQAVQDIFRDDRRMERLLAWATLGFGTMALVFGVIHFRNGISAPFSSRGLREIAGSQSDSGNPQFAELSQQDTDGDGLNDYDELYVHQTSPYLEDSDSDGVGDGQELVSSTNPNCAFERNCEQLGASTAAQLGTELDTSALLGAVQINGQITPQKVRELLLAVGVEQSKIDSLDDVAVLEVYQEMLHRVTQTLNTAPAATEPPTISGQGDISQYSAAQLRQLLLDNGVAQATVDAISDEQLFELAAQAVAN